VANLWVFWLPVCCSIASAAATLALIGIAVLAVAGSFALAAPLRRATAPRHCACHGHLADWRTRYGNP
jgi:hypothetical protein